MSFVVAGAAIFMISAFFTDSEISRVIELSDSDVERLSGNWRMQRGRKPLAEELDEIVDQYLRDEIYFRESQRLGLHVNDSIIRRRLVQKLTFLTEDIANAQPLEEKAIRDHFDDNAKDYRVAERLSFEHKFFSNERRENAKKDAQLALESGDAGDSFTLQKEYIKRTPHQIRGFLGDQFTAAIMALETAPTWQGPIPSTYGWHVVKLYAVEESFIPEFQAVKERVARDAVIAIRSSANASYYADLKSRYEVIYPTSLQPVQ